MSPTLAEAVEQAQIIAIQRLVNIITTSTSDREVRLAAQVILRFNPSRATASRATASGSSGPVAVPPPAPTATSPLTPAELAQLRTLLPHVPKEHFTRRHSPRQWREVLASATSDAAAAPLRQAG
jgi:hypothetical protein